MTKDENALLLLTRLDINNLIADYENERINVDELIDYLKEVSVNRWP